MKDNHIVFLEMYQISKNQRNEDSHTRLQVITVTTVKKCTSLQSITTPFENTRNSIPKPETRVLDFLRAQKEFIQQ